MVYPAQLLMASIPALWWWHSEGIFLFTVPNEDGVVLSEVDGDVLLTDLNKDPTAGDYIYVTPPLTNIEPSKVFRLDIDQRQKFFREVEAKMKLLAKYASKLDILKNLSFFGVISSSESTMTLCCTNVSMFPDFEWRELGAGMLDTVPHSLEWPCENQVVIPPSNILIPTRFERKQVI